MSPPNRVPLRALQTQAALSEHLPLGDIVRPQPPRAELLSLLRAHQSRYHTPTSARPETGAVNSAGEPSLPPEVGALLAKDPWQPELWATAAMEQMGWQMDWSNDSHIRVERALKVCSA